MYTCVCPVWRERSREEGEGSRMSKNRKRRMCDEYWVEGGGGLVEKGEEGGGGAQTAVENIEENEERRREGERVVCVDYEEEESPMGTNR